MIIFLISILGGLLRIYNNTALSLWHDEAFSALYLRYNWGEMMSRIGLDVHPPLYYWILRLWAYIFGDGLASLRSLSIILGVLTIWAAYLVVRQAFQKQAPALLAALFVAINPFQIQYALEARMYTLGTLLVLLSSYFLLQALEDGKRKHWIWYALTAAGCLYTHYFLIFSVAAQGLYALYYLIANHQLHFDNFKTGRFLKTVYGFALTILLFLPWLPTFITQNTRVSEQFWIPQMDRWSVPGTIWKMLFGGDAVRHFYLILATLVVLGFLWYFCRKIKAQEKWLIVLMLVVPFLGSILLSLKTAIYLDRYFVFAALFLTIMLALVLDRVPHSKIRTGLILLFIFGSLFFFFRNWRHLDIANKPGMAKAAEYVNQNALRDDKIYVSSSFVYFTYKYYNQTDIKPLLFSSGPLETIPHFSGTAILTNEDLILDFNQAEQNDSVWLVWTTGFGSNKPVTPGNWSIVAEKEFRDAPDFKGSIFITQYHVR